MKTTVSQPTQPKRFKSSTIHNTPCVIDNHNKHYALFETAYTADQTAKRFNGSIHQNISGYSWNPIVVNEQHKQTNKQQC